MSIGTISNATFPSYGVALQAANSGKVSLPVPPGMVIYSHFKHVSGTPAPEGTQGVNISKLKILNTLIDQLAKVKNDPAIRLDITSENDEKRVNALIEQYQKQLKAAQSVNFYTPSTQVTGLLFNISV